MQFKWCGLCGWGGLCR